MRRCSGGSVITFSIPCGLCFASKFEASGRSFDFESKGILAEAEKQTKIAPGWSSKWKRSGQPASRVILLLLCGDDFCPCSLISVFSLRLSRTRTTKDLILANDFWRYFPLCHKENERFKLRTLILTRSLLLTSESNDDITFNDHLLLSREKNRRP